ncbi:MAG TPA: penicillin-binding transpeptidase domain-containing protein [Candidatus Dojkabacteria bacterium]|nr:penicillin-binding transpeptidase domain-containing protein [Candidatus Dojkabacteria bacterium]
MNLKLSKKLEAESLKSTSVFTSVKLSDVKTLYKEVVKDVKKKNSSSQLKMSGWNYIVPFIVMFTIFILMFSAMFNLQVVNGKTLYQRSVNNRLEIVNIPAKRGVIFDRNGVKIAENIPSVNVSVDLREFKEDGEIDEERLREVLDKVSRILPEKFESTPLQEKIFSTLEGMNATEKALAKYLPLARGVDNQTAVLLKSSLEDLKGIVIDDGAQRKYPSGTPLSHILGYTGDVYAEDLEKLDYVEFDDVIGKLGIEKIYDKELFGKDGKVAREVDSLGNILSDSETVLKEAVSGSSLYLSIDSKAQSQMYKVLEKGVKENNATGAVGILQDVNTGEVIVLGSYPSFDNNKFIGGISVDDYNKLLKDKRTPLNNRAIAAQVPPGSTFKTIIAAAALDAGVINRNTVYVSRAGYTFSNGARFQEYRDKVYGPLTIVDALSVSSNIFFCETIRSWDMNKLVPYLKKFGIGEYTYIDIPGEGSGMLPSPENKIRLAKTTSPWLDPIWYPEGDSCNSVIGQGITTVTPIQMSNWVAAIANGGTLYKPHVGTKLVDAKGGVTEINRDPLRVNIVSESALKIVREGMWASVNGPRRVIFPLTDAKVEIAAKTGTAEFGRVNSKGIYEHTHAWVTGFFPYEKPKYSFVVLLEDGGESYKAAMVAREFIDWWVDYSKK